jgi:cytochrome c peroxidase
MKKADISALMTLLCCAIFAMQACRPEKPPVKQEDSGPTPYNLDLPGGWPLPVLDPQNPLTVEGIDLGRKLFYDPMLSTNYTQSCASCHNIDFAFTDNGKKLSTGSEGLTGIRNSMPLFNLNWSTGYFWEGRQATLESLIQEPIEAHFEMNLSLDSAVGRLKKHPDYPSLFRKAFPGKEISAVSLRYAIAQFIRTISSYETKWDEYFRKDPRFPDKYMTPAQKRGYQAFISEEKGDCFHCHAPIHPLFISILDREYTNNGLDANPAPGRMQVTGNANDRGKFKTPTLRNVLLTAPYMHDGRFATIEEVLDHYDHGLKYSPTLDPMLVKHLDEELQPVPRMSVQDKADIIEFLKLLTDESLPDNPAYQNPF